MNEEYKINNKPDYADDYEFIVATRWKDQWWFYGAYTNGFYADRAASMVDGVIFHNVRIQGKRRHDERI